MRAQVADTPELRAAAGALVAYRYGQEGYGQPELPTGDNSHTLVVLSGAALVGTLTVTIDDGTGLLADEAYRQYLDDRRAVKGLCAEITKFAFVESPKSRGAHDVLYRLASDIMAQHGCTDLFIEVNPKQAKYYKERLRFWQVGEVTVSDRVNAPARLLWIDRRHFSQTIAPREGRRP
ncbi:MAG: N-acyl amino acid synthase FeeM domain-containing protein [Janthinobacterium lividum]